MLSPSRPSQAAGTSDPANLLKLAAQLESLAQSVRQAAQSTSSTDATGTAAGSGSTAAAGAAAQPAVHAAIGDACGDVDMTGPPPAQPMQLRASLPGLASTVSPAPSTTGDDEGGAANSNRTGAGNGKSSGKLSLGSSGSGLPPAAKKAKKDRKPRDFDFGKFRTR